MRCYGTIGDAVDAIGASTSVPNDGAEPSVFESAVERRV